MKYNNSYILFSISTVYKYKELQNFLLHSLGEKLEYVYERLYNMAYAR